MCIAGHERERKWIQLENIYRKTGKPVQVKVCCVDNAGFFDELTVGEIYEGEYGVWCPNGWHLVEDGKVYCNCRQNQGEKTVVWKPTIVGIKLRNDQGEVDVWGVWNFEIIEVLDNRTERKR